MDVGFDINLVRALVLLALIAGFVGIWAWAWSRNRKQEFDAMSQLPLEEDGPPLRDDPAPPPRCH